MNSSKEEIEKLNQQINQLIPTNTKGSFDLTNENLSLICVSLDKSNFELDSNRQNIIVENITHHTEYLKSLFHSSPNNNPEYFHYYLREKQNRLRRYSNRLANDPTFKDTQITLSFLDDGDLDNDYSLYLLMDKNLDEVLYSCRVFSGLSDVKAEVSGGKSIEEISKDGVDDYTFQMQLEAVKYAKTLDESCVVFDRLSGKRSTNDPYLATYAKYLLYKFFLKNEYNKGKRRLICLARQEKENRLLHGYVNLGLEIKGIANYLIGDREISHWLLCRNIEEISLHANNSAGKHSLLKTL